MDKYKERNINIYRNQKERNIEEIKSIISSIEVSGEVPFDVFKDLFENSSEVIASSWESGRKYSRTTFVQGAFQEEFPEKYLEFSLVIDAMINILDDLFDEDLSSERKTIYIVEFLRNFAIYNQEEVPQEIRTLIGTYFNKLITLALSEKIYQEKIAKINDIDELSEKSVDLLMCRGMDIDIFIEIAMIGYNGDCDSIRRAGRIFRAMNIFKKDIVDIPYDLENNMQTVVTMVLSKKSISFEEYANNVMNLMFKEKEKIKKNKIVNNFGEMMTSLRSEVLKISKLN